MFAADVYESTTSGLTSPKETAASRNDSESKATTPPYSNQIGSHLDRNRMVKNYYFGESPSLIEECSAEDEQSQEFKLRIESS